MSDTNTPPATISNVRLSGRLPKGELNGITSLAADLVTTPGRRRFAVITFDCSQVTTATDSHEQFPTVRILSVEPIVNVDDVAKVQEARDTAYQERTGALMLPDGDDQDAAAVDPVDPSEPTEAERLAQAAEEHVAAHPDSVIARAVKNTTPTGTVRNLFTEPKISTGDVGDA